MLYFFEEKSGHVALVKPDASKLDIVSEFQVTKGEGPFLGSSCNKQWKALYQTWKCINGIPDKINAEKSVLL